MYGCCKRANMKTLFTCIKIELTTIALDFQRKPSPHVALHAVRFQCETSQSILGLSLLLWSNDDDDVDDDDVEDDDNDLTSVCEYDCNLLPTCFPVCHDDDD